MRIGSSKKKHIDIDELKFLAVAVSARACVSV